LSLPAARREREAPRADVEPAQDAVLVASEGDFLREAAQEGLQRSLLALQLLPLPDATFRGLIQTVDRSLLSEDRRAALRERLEARQSAGQAVDSAVGRVGGGGSEGRWAIAQGLLAAEQALATAPEPVGGGAIDERVERWIQQLVAEAAGPEVGAAAVATLRVALYGLLLDEEEEEPLPTDYASETSGC
jgi:hypothetical protein